MPSYTWTKRHYAQPSSASTASTRKKNADRFGQEKKKLTDRKEFYEKRLQVYNDSVCRLEANIEAIDKVYNLPEISLVAAIFGHQKNGKEVHPPDGEPLEAVAAAEMPAPSYDVCSALTGDAPLDSIDPKDANGKQCTADTGSF
jgi:hypothetical protein